MAGTSHPACTDRDSADLNASKRARAWPASLLGESGAPAAEGEECGGRNRSGLAPGQLAAVCRLPAVPSAPADHPVACCGAASRRQPGKQKTARVDGPLARCGISYPTERRDAAALRLPLILIGHHLLLCKDGEGEGASASAAPVSHTQPRLSIGGLAWISIASPKE
jgi:hypothetical protein